MGRIDFFLGVLLCALVVPARTPGLLRSSVLEMSTFALSGSVFSEGSNQRISQASVVLCDDGGNSLQESYAGDSGEFSFQGLRPGHYILRVKAVGFQPSELHVDLSLTSERGLTVSLKPVPTAALPAHGSEIVSAHELAMPQGARDLLASGKKKLYTEKNAQAALRDFQAATGQAPTYYEAYYQTGMAYLALQNPAEAEKQFHKSVEISQKKYGDADIALGTLLLHRNELNEGESLLRMGLASNPNSWPGQFEVGELELSRGHLESALAAAEKAAELAPQQAVVYRLLAVIHLRQKNYLALVSALDSYIELDPDSPAGVRAKELRAQAEKQLANTGEAAVAAKK
jgi:hypothetical protein